MEKDLTEKIKDLPMGPGVYIFKNSKGKIIYIGKAKHLKNRVSSYFRRNLDLGTKTTALVERIEEIEHIDTTSELEALLLEAEMIKKHRPKYNIALKDDKSYLYIVIRKEKSSLHKELSLLPKIMAVRKTDIKPKDETFGPYPDGSTARYIVRMIRKIFPYRDCAVSKYHAHSKEGKPCLYGHIGLCRGPCSDSGVIEDYKKDIKNIKRFLSGDSSYLLKEYKKKMEEASVSQKYEEAAYYRDLLSKFEYVRSSFSTADKFIENPNLVEDLAEISLEKLKDTLPFLNKPPKRIECYDISNVSGKESVGSMVVAINGLIEKSEYKKFKIKTKNTPDDFYMMSEMLRRRLKRTDWEFPDLLVMDGGKGQVSSVRNVMKELNLLDIPLVGLAKKKETIVFFDGKNFSELQLSKDDEGLRLLMRLRDEAHRFAQSYHHHLRLKKIKV